ncbi:MAG TPA: tRNA (N(6)-L-threonylcarbamoyladenosine(37)-C(2))-methylthiotransferase [Thermoplasmata archaeon]|nr:tRNA (N(6)-L-threonylcarbamoyladenosine(37)-C(2))-methylthiotransferase [Thermoplasmata archaeon]
MQVYVEAFGCAQNLGEASAIERAVHAAGHPIVDDPAQADVGVLVTCGVIGATESRMVRRYRSLRERIPRLIVTGCLVPLRTGLFDDPDPGRTAFLPIRQQTELPALLDRWSGSSPSESGTTPPPLVLRSAAEEVVIAQGCTSHCTYCFSRLARGPLQSVAPLDVLARVRAAHNRGAVEVRLTSLDTSCWGEDLPGSGGLPVLLDLIARIPGEFQVRLGMMSPQSLTPIADRYFHALQHPRFFRFLHLPVQSGSDRVLREMRRGYTVAEFRDLVRTARASVPGLTLSTDIIAGFPGETDEDFDATLSLVNEVGPEIVNVTRFSARPMTPAARLRPVPGGVAKRRSRALTELRMRLARSRLERWIGWEGRAVVVEQGSGETRVARMPNYLPVVLSGAPPLGSSPHVRVDGARSTYLLGRTVSEGETGPHFGPPL